MLGWVMMLGAQAAPSAGLCEQWRATLEAQAKVLSETEHAVDHDHVRVQRARVGFDTFTASVDGDVCRIRAVGEVDLRGEVQVAVYGVQTSCPVQLARAPVVARLDVTGTQAEPRIRSSLADLDGLKGKMSLCVNLDPIKALVVNVANDWVRRQLPQWHGAIESSLKR